MTQAFTGREEILRIFYTTRELDLTVYNLLMQRDVTVEDVRTMRYPGKAKRALMGRMARNQQKGRRASFKKAVVQLAEGDSIELYEAG